MTSKKVFLMILVVVIMLTMLRLGVWQLDRAQHKRELLQTIQSRASQTPADLLQLIQDPASLQQYLPVRVRGHYDEAGSILIDNQVIDSVNGYWLVTPFRIEGSSQSVLVKRGWLPMGLDRQVLPEYATDDATMTIRGRFNTVPAKPAFWKDSYAINQGKVWQYLPLDEYQKQTRLSVLSMLLELDPTLDGVGGYRRQWQQFNDASITKHQGYAFQWFALALAFLILCVLMATRTLKLKTSA